MLSLRVQNVALDPYERRQISETVPCQVEKIIEHVIGTSCLAVGIFYLKKYSKN